MLRSSVTISMGFKPAFSASVYGITSMRVRERLDAHRVHAGERARPLPELLRRLHLGRAAAAR